MRRITILTVLLLAAVFMFSACNNPAANTLPPEESDPSQVLSESPSEEEMRIYTAKDASAFIHPGMTIEEIRELTGGRFGTDPKNFASIRGWYWSLSDGSGLEVFFESDGAVAARITYILEEDDRPERVLFDEVEPDNTELFEGQISYIKKWKDESDKIHTDSNADEKGEKILTSKDAVALLKPGVTVDEIRILTNGSLGVEYFVSTYGWLWHLSEGSAIQVFFESDGTAVAARITHMFNQGDDRPDVVIFDEVDVKNTSLSEEQISYIKSW